MRPPKWTIDETILAVYTYFEIGDVTKVTVDNPLIGELSKTLRNMPIHKNWGEKFRNIPGIRMTLFSIAALDNEAAYSMRDASKIQKRVYQHYVDKKHYLREIAGAIKGCLPLPFEYYEPVDHSPLIEGNILYLYHLYIENSSRQAKILKKDFAGRKKSTCLVCHRDLIDIYSDKGFYMLELHYSESFTRYKNTMDILPGKFIPVCPSCHKLSHSNAELFTLDNLKLAVITGGQNNV